MGGRAQAKGGTEGEEEPDFLLSRKPSAWPGPRQRLHSPHKPPRCSGVFLSFIHKKWQGKKKKKEPDLGILYPKVA